MKKMFITKILSLVVITAFAVSPMLPVAPALTKDCAGGSNALTLLPAWYKGLSCDDKGTIQIGSGGLRGFIFKIVANLIEALFYIVGYVSLAMIIWGGFKYMMQGDSSSGTEDAKKTIMNAVIGLIISIFAVVIVNLIAGAF